MQNSKLRFTVNETVKFSKSTILSNNNGPSSGNQIPPTTKVISNLGTAPQDYDEESDTFGGIIFNGQLAWMANGSQIEVVSLKNGYKVSSYTFNNSLFANTQITYVTEINVVGYQKICILAICVQCSPALTGGSLLCLFAVHGSRLLRCIEFDDRITSCTYINSLTCSQNRLMQFDGAIVLGTNHGKLLLCDLKLKELRNVLCGKTIGNNELQIHSSCIIVSDANFNEIEANHERSSKESGHFCIQFEDSQLGGQIAPILSLLVLEPLFTIAAGLADGRLILYDLCDLIPFHVAHPPENDSPLLKLSFMEPSDDPRACCFVWAFHVCANNQAVAVMHSLMFERKLMNNEQDYIYNNFQACSPRLTLRIPEQTAFPLVCQSISKPIPDEESFLSLCMLAWSSTPSSYACIFDLNQWYKEQMPSHCELIDNPSYLVYFPLNVAGRSNNYNTRNALDIWVNANTVTPFNSIHRPEEHFYPSSLNFDCTLLTCRNAEQLHWSGLQNEILKTFSCSGSNAILDPNQCFDEMICASLIPQFTDYNENVCLTTKQKQDFLLSIALEYNCVGLLKECAKVWANGSHLGRQPNEGLSLFTLTDWICDRATLIKNRCNNLCNSLFDHSGLTIDYRSRMTLSHYSRQLKILSELLQMIITTCHQFIPSNALDTLQSKRNSIQMVAEYQEILQWLLNMGLLPEGIWNNDSTGNNLINEYSSLSTSTIVPYPYRILRNYYVAQRRKFCEINRSLISTKTKSCRLLYIDAFIEKECNSALLRNEWKQGCMSDGLYPPPSLQSMLRTLLVPGVSIENKYMLFVYMFLDLNMVLNDERYAAVVQNLIKFPAVFKLDPALIKTTQAFWNLDHCEFETAVDELISPLSQDHHIFKWQHELLIESLLVQDVSHLALRALRSLRPPISPSLEMKTLLVNNLVSEAFQLQRTRADPSLLQEFFHDCHKYNRWSAVLDLALSTDEEQALCKYLRANPTQLNSNLHFLYLLQRNKYTEANTLVEQLRQSGSSKFSSNTTAGSLLKRQGLTLDTPSTILSAYKITMTPAIRHLSQLYHSVKDSINSKLNKAYESPMPLSSNLLQSSDTTKNIFSNIYHQTVLCTEQTTESYWYKQRQQKCSLTDDDVPFLRAPNYSEIFSGTASTMTTKKDCIIEPTIYVANKKRRMDSDLECDERGNEIRELDDGPRKRMRIESINDGNRINASLLTSFRDSSEISKSTPIKKRVTAPAPAINEEDDDISMVSVQKDALLSTPIVKSLQQQQKESAHITGISSAVIAAATNERSSTPHSILKVKGVESSSTSTCSRSYSPFLYTNASSIVGDNVATEVDEKSIRFNLPQSPDIIRSNDVSAEENVSTITSTNRYTSYLGATTRSAIRSCDISASSNSCDEFYSPNTTQNIVDEIQNDQDNDQDEALQETIANDSQNNSVIQEAQEKTPQMVNYPQGRRSYRSRSRTPEQNQDHCIPIEINPPNERRATKSLSRMVLEANAIKSVTGNEMVAEISKHRTFLNETEDSLSTIGGANQSLEQSYESMIQGKSPKNWLVDSDANEIDVVSTENDDNGGQDGFPITEEICVEKFCYVTTDNTEPSPEMDKEEFEDTSNLVETMEVDEIKVAEEEPPNEDKMPVVEQVCVKKFSYDTTVDDPTGKNRPFQSQHLGVSLTNLQSSTPKDIPSNKCQLESDSHKLIDNEPVFTATIYNKRRNLFNETADDAVPTKSQLFDQTISDFNDTSMMEIMTKFGPKNYLTDDTALEVSLSQTNSLTETEPQNSKSDDPKQMISLLSSSESEDDDDVDDDEEDEDQDDNDVQDFDDEEDEEQDNDDVQDVYEYEDHDVDEDVDEEESSESNEESTSNEENSSDENKADSIEIVNISSDSDELELEINDQEEHSVELESSGGMVQIESKQSELVVLLSDPVLDDKVNTEIKGSGSSLSISDAQAQVEIYTDMEVQVDDNKTFAVEIVQSHTNDELITEVEESAIPDSSLLIRLSKKDDEITSNENLTTVSDVEVGLVYAVDSNNPNDKIAPQPTIASTISDSSLKIGSSQDPSNHTVPEVETKIEAIDTDQSDNDQMVMQPTAVLSVEMEVTKIPDSSQQPIEMTSNKNVSSVPEAEFKIDSVDVPQPTTVSSVEVASILDLSLKIPSSQEQIAITANEIVKTPPEVEIKINSVESNNTDDQMAPQPSTFSSVETNIELPVNVFENSADNDEFQQSLQMEDDDSLDYASAEQSHVTDDNMTTTSNLHNVCLMLDDNISVPEISTTSNFVSDDQENPLPAESVNEETFNAVEPSTSFNTADDMSSYQKLSESNCTIGPADQCQIDTKMFENESFENVNESVLNLPDDMAKTETITDEPLKTAEEIIKVTPKDHDLKNALLESDLQNSPAEKHFAIETNESEPIDKNTAIETKKSKTSSLKSEIILNKRQTRSRSQSINIEEQSPLINELNSSNSVVVQRITRRGNSEPPQDIQYPIMARERTSQPETPKITQRRRTSFTIDDQTTPRRRSRASSVLSDNVDSPARHTRSAKLEHDQSISSTPGKRKTITQTTNDDEDAVSVGSARSTRSKKSIASGSSSVKSKTNKKQIEKIVVNLQPIDEENQEDTTYSDSRRMTRTQKAMLAKMAKQEVLSATTSGLKRKFDEISSPNIDEQNLSDTETVASKDSRVSKTSSSTTRKRGRPRKKTTDDDSESIASSTRTSKTTRSRAKKELSTIDESDKSSKIRTRKASTSSSKK